MRRIHVTNLVTGYIWEDWQLQRRWRRSEAEGPCSISERSLWQHWWQLWGCIRIVIIIIFIINLSLQIRGVYDNIDDNFEPFRLIVYQPHLLLPVRWYLSKSQRKTILSKALCIQIAIWFQVMLLFNQLALTSSSWSTSPRPSSSSSSSSYSLGDAASQPAFTDWRKEDESQGVVGYDW